MMRTMRIVAMLAWRNLWRNHRRTIIMLSAITIGAWAMIFMTALSRGMVSDMIRDGIQSLPGHIQVHNPAYRDDPSIGNLIPDTDRDIAARFGKAGISNWTSRIRVPAVVTSERDSRGVTFIGIDPQRERTMSFVADDIVEGRFLESVDDTGLVMGARLADILDTELGKRVVVMSQDPANDIADRGYRIVGIFKAKLEAQETAMLFAGKATVQKMLGIEGRVNEIAVMGDDYRDVEPLFEKVDAAFDNDVEVLRWMDIELYLASTMKFMDSFVLIFVVIIFLALAFGLVNTLVMAIFERMREIGMLMALGMRPSAILAEVMMESFFLLVIGLTLGNLLAFATLLPLQDGIDLSFISQGLAYFGYASVLYPEAAAKDVVLANVTVLILGFFASLSPAWRASRYEPVEALNKE